MKRLMSDVTLERTSNLWTSSVTISIFLLMEVWKQMSNFGLIQRSGGQYPLPPPILVIFVELTKLVFVFFWMVHKPGEKFRPPSPMFALPALCYLVTNSLYLHALTRVSPPLWLLLIQTKTLYTALAYKVLFGRKLTYIQIAGCFFIVSSVTLARMASLNGDIGMTVTYHILLMSQLSAALSTAASIAVELLLKNDNRSFCEQQMWLYASGTLLGVISLPLTLNLPEALSKFKERSPDMMVTLLMLSAVTSSALSGLCVPHIVKSLDSIAKDYLSALNNLVLSVLTSLVFPRQFTLTWTYLLSLSLLLVGIAFYERKTTEWRLPLREIRQFSLMCYSPLRRLRRLWTYSFRRDNVELLQAHP